MLIEVVGNLGGTVLKELWCYVGGGANAFHSNNLLLPFSLLYSQK